VAGNDLAGVIVAVGSDVKGRSVGTPVFGMTDREDSALNGSFSEYALVSAQSTAPKPNNLSYAEAAGLGVVGVTALRILDQAQVRSGKRVLITGVAGGVGSTTAQMAVARGATVKWHRLPASCGLFAVHRRQSNHRLPPGKYRRSSGSS